MVSLLCSLLASGSNIQPTNANLTATAALTYGIGNNAPCSPALTTTTPHRHPNPISPTQSSPLLLIRSSSSTTTTTTTITRPPPATAIATAPSRHRPTPTCADSPPSSGLATSGTRLRMNISTRCARLSWKRVPVATTRRHRRTFRTVLGCRAICAIGSASTRAHTPTGNSSSSRNGSSRASRE